MTKVSEKTIATFDHAVYQELLAKFEPKIIETETEYNRALAIAKQFTFAKNLTPEEVEAYETEPYPMDESTPHEILQHWMEANETRQAQLVGVIGSSGVVSKVVNGKRSISQAQTKALGNYFSVSPSLFI